MPELAVALPAPPAASLPRPRLWLADRPLLAIGLGLVVVIVLLLLILVTPESEPLITRLLMMCALLVSAVTCTVVLAVEYGRAVANGSSCTPHAAIDAVPLVMLIEASVFAADGLVTVIE